MGEGCDKGNVGCTGTETGIVPYLGKGVIVAMAPKKAVMMG